MMDGLSQIHRRQRMDEMKHFTVVDNSMESLLDQMEAFAGAIRYYDPNGSTDEYFDQFLKEVKDIHQQIENNTYDQEAEPAQALMYTFLKHLHGITTKFNERWNQYAGWYFNEILKTAPLSSLTDSAWIVLSKNIPEDIQISKGMKFTCDAADAEDRIYYRAQTDTCITDISLRRMYSVYFEENADIWPASLCRLTTALKMMDLLADNRNDRGMIFKELEHTKAIQPLGIQVCSPSLILREGKRFVCLEFKSEKTRVGVDRIIQELAGRIMEDKKGYTSISRMEDIEKEIRAKIFTNLFYLEISTTEGWSKICSPSVHLSDDTLSLIIRFELPEHFPRTIPCNDEVHQKETAFPALRILLNHDSWLYPYSWLRDFKVAKVKISTHVEGVSNLMFYNDLGRADTSIPFAPFGTNTERGAWFVIGNYEMAVKSILSADIHLQWQQLPDDDDGLDSYYSAYKDNIDNRSFQLKTKFLSDYRWKNTPDTEPVYLFSSVLKCKDGTPERNSRLSDESVIRNIPLEKMEPVSVPEEEYNYSIQAKNGFINFVLESPVMGLGEKRYRQIFSQQMALKALRKKGGHLLNPPLTPLIERITLSYHSEDEIDLRRWNKTGCSEIAHIYPFGEQYIYPNKDNQPQVFLYSLETAANLIFAFDNVKGDETLSLYFDFAPQKKEVSLYELPRLVWYWGDGYSWEKLPDGCINKNTTQGFLTSGHLSIYIPVIPDGMRDKDGLIWFRAAITQNEQSISAIKRVYVNAIKVSREQELLKITRPDDFVLNSSDPPIPGIPEITQITPFSRKSWNEDEEDKLMRISEFITHREKAVTIRDYERMTLQAFPEVGKVKCLPNINTKSEADNKESQGIVTLVIIPEGEKQYRPCASPELLLRIEKYFRKQVSAYVHSVDAVNPEYEELLVRCRVEYLPKKRSQSYADVRVLLRRMINNWIAPWYQKDESPSFTTAIRPGDLYDKIKGSGWIHEITYLSVVQLSGKGDDTFLLKEYTKMDDIITATRPHAVLVPSENHIITSDVNGQFGIGEMGVNENFVIWQNETEIR